MSLKQIIYDLAEESGRKIPRGSYPGRCVIAGFDCKEIDVEYSFDALGKAGTMMGSAAVMVFDEDTDVVKLLHRITRFFVMNHVGNVPLP